MNDDPRRRAVLDVTPTSALLPPNGRVPIEVTFCPREEKFHNFNLAFNVRKKLTKLSINVKGEGFKVGARVGVASVVTSLCVYMCVCAVVGSKFN